MVYFENPAVTLLQQLPYPVIAFAPVTGADGEVSDLEFVSMNEAACDFYGLPADRLLGHRVSHEHPHARESGLLDLYLDVAATGVSAVVHAHRPMSTHAGPPGRVYDITAVHVNGLVVVTWIDSTERVQALAEVAALQAQTGERPVGRILHALPDPCVFLLPVRSASGQVTDLVIETANPAACEWLGRTPAEVVSHHASDLFPDERSQHLIARYGALCGSSQTESVEAVSPPGSTRKYDVRAVAHADGLLVTWCDVTDREAAIDSAREAEYRYRLLADAATDVIWQFTPEGVIEWCSSSVSKLLGWSARELVGMNSLELVHPADLPTAIEGRAGFARGLNTRLRIRVRRADGTFCWVQMTDLVVPTPRGQARVASLHDISKEVAAREQLATVIGRDPLTGLDTRQTLESELDADDQQHHVLAIGVDLLGDINDALGHAAGDMVLAEIAARIAGHCGEETRLARGDGADFIAVLPAGIDPGRVAKDLLDRAREPISIGVRRVRVTVSIGVADGVGSGPVREALAALRLAKDAGRDQMRWADPSSRLTSAQRHTLRAEIEDGLEKGEFITWLQPIVTISSGSVVGHEALARWGRNSGNAIGPAVFIPAIEGTPLAARMFAATLGSALEALEALPDHHFVSVNVPASALASDAYIETAARLLHASSVRASRIHLEVTETSFLAASRDVAARMESLASVGVRWYVDDFGTGYSSIAHLRDLPIAGIKLDISFTQVLTTDVRTRELAAGLMGLARGLGLDAIAEGIETEEQAEVLRNQGWLRGQGWLYGRPVPPPPGLNGQQP